MEVRMLAEKWSNQDEVEITDQEWEELQEMDMEDKFYWMTDKFPYLDMWDMIECSITPAKEDNHNAS